MKKLIFLLLILTTLHCGAVPGSNNGHHTGGGNSGNGKGNGQIVEENPAEVPGDPDQGAKEVPLDNIEIALLFTAGAIVYVIIQKRKVVKV